MKHEIIVILLFSFTGDAMNVPERMQPIEPVPELNLEKELESWKEELVALRSRYLRSSTPGRARKKKVTKKHRIYT